MRFSVIPKKREVYDKYGEEGLKEGSGGMDADDIFSMFGFPFGGRRGGGGPGRGPRGKPKGKDVAVAYPVTLEDLYCGKQAKYPFDKTIVCPTCTGTGAKKGGAQAKCKSCNGEGYKVHMRHVGFGLVQQMQEPCGACNGEGEVIKPKDRCTKCSGAKTIEQPHNLDIFVDKGMSHNQKITFSGEGDQIPGVTPGDIILVLQQAEHPIFKRDGVDLYMDKKIKLSEALCGFSFLITHLDGRSLLVKSTPGEIIRPNDTKCIEGEGMPQYKNPFEKGRLFVKFEIEFPENGSISAESNKALLNILPKGANLGKMSDEVEEVLLSEPTQSNGRGRGKRANSRGSNHGHMHYQESDEEDDDDERGHGHGVQCHQQ